MSAQPSVAALSPRHSVSVMSTHRAVPQQPVASVPILSVAAAPARSNVVAQPLLMQAPEEKEEPASFFVFPSSSASVAELDEEVAAQMLYVDVRATSVWRAAVSRKGLAVAALFLFASYLTGAGIVSLLLWAFAGAGCANWVLRRQLTFDAELPLELLQVFVVAANSVMRVLHSACNLIDMDKAIGVVAVATFLVWLNVL